MLVPQLELLSWEVLWGALSWELLMLAVVLEVDLGLALGCLLEESLWGL